MDEPALFDAYHEACGQEGSYEKNVPVLAKAFDDDLVGIDNITQEFREDERFMELLRTIGKMVFVPQNWNGIKMDPVHLQFKEGFEEHRPRVRVLKFALCGFYFILCTMNSKTGSTLQFKTKKYGCICRTQRRKMQQKGL